MLANGTISTVRSEIVNSMIVSLFFDYDWYQDDLVLILQVGLCSEKA